MGGPGSGRWYRWDSKDTTENHNRIDIRWLRKQGYLRPNTSGSLSWSSGDEQSDLINFMLDSGQMTLKYLYRYRGGELESVEQVIPFDRTPCNFGGHRLWFLCPRCYKRVALLYGAGKYFYCRNCHNLNYASQHESMPDRLMRKARKIRKILGASNNLTEQILFKPKGVHQTTFDRLRREADQASLLSLTIMARRDGIRL